MYSIIPNFKVEWRLVRIFLADCRMCRFRSLECFLHSMMKLIETMIIENQIVEYMHCSSIRSIGFTIVARWIELDSTIQHILMEYQHTSEFVHPKYSKFNLTRLSLGLQRRCRFEHRRCRELLVLQSVE
jgi:hypothetical protein